MESKQKISITYLLMKWEIKEKRNWNNYTCRLHDGSKRIYDDYGNLPKRRKT